MVDSAVMPRYSFTLEDGAFVAPEDATEELPDDQAAMHHAELVAKDLSRTTTSGDHWRVVARDETGKELGSIPVIFDRR